MTSELSGLIRKKAELWIRFIKSKPSGIALRDYKICARLVKKGLKEATKNYERDLINKAFKNHSMKNEKGEYATKREKRRYLINSLNRFSRHEGQIIHT